MQTSIKRFFWFSYATDAVRDLRRDGVDIHKTRDGDMFADLAAGLYGCGYEYGGRVLNLPPWYATKRREEHKLFCTSDDCLVLPTRPPLSDPESELKKIITPSETEEESKVFDLLSPVFHSVDRGRVILSPGLAASLDKKTQQYAEAHFQMYGADRVTKLYREQKPKESFSLAYLAYLHGPDFRLLTAFGASGIMTALWGELLRSFYMADFQEWIESPEDRLVICRITPPEKYPYPMFSDVLDPQSHEIVVNATFSPMLH